MTVYLVEFFVKAKGGIPERVRKEWFSSKLEALNCVSCNEYGILSDEDIWMKVSIRRKDIPLEEVVKILNKEERV